ncbi:MAG: UDP-N-acetylmuramate dehydrogenase [Patescibacteria group bacterium]
MTSIQILRQSLPNLQVQVPLAPMTTFRVGGSAEFFVKASDAQQLEGAIRAALDASVPFTVLGGGSNVLVADSGIRGLVVHSSGGIVQWNGEQARADAGVLLAQFVSEATQKGMSGLEYAAGIPGTVGGAVRGNAGTRVGETSERIVAVGAISPSAVKKMFDPVSCEFQYRHSFFKHSGWIVLRAVFQFQLGDPAQIRSRVQEYQKHKTATQQVGAPNSGCIFQNTRLDAKEEHRLKGLGLEKGIRNHCMASGWIIEEAGLKGLCIGGAQVSDVHANFIANTGDATAEDIVMLIGVIKQKIRTQYGIQLREEIQLLGW